MQFERFNVIDWNVALRNLLDQIECQVLKPAWRKLSHPAEFAGLSLDIVVDSHSHQHKLYQHTLSEYLACPIRRWNPGYT